MDFLQENMCMFLNETVSPTEQAQALGIDLELYERLVTIRKNNLEDESLAGQMNLAVHFHGIHFSYKLIIMAIFFRDNSVRLLALTCTISLIWLRKRSSKAMISIFHFYATIFSYSTLGWAIANELRMSWVEVLTILECICAHNISRNSRVRSVRA